MAAEWAPCASTRPRVLATNQRAFRITGTETDGLELGSPTKHGARYDRPGRPKSFYAAFAHHVMLVELEQRHGRLDHFRLTTLQIKGRLLDAFAAEGLRRLGLERTDLVQRDNAACLALADYGRDLGCSGLIVPSSKIPGEANVVIWREAVGDVVRVINSRILTIRYPGGRPPAA
jgi:RES domain-containing protein